MPHTLVASRAEDPFSLSEGSIWNTLSAAIRDYDPDVIVLVARKMPRLFEAFRLDFGQHVICVSDQAIPFVEMELKNARVAIVDDVWNVGTTMLHAKMRVQEAGPQEIRLFALGAKDATEARKSGVNLTIPVSLSAGQYRHLVESVPQVLKLVAKPYDADFPIIPCRIRPPLNSWGDCWAWLKAYFGESVHCVVDPIMIKHGFARATVNLRNESMWTVKARLYFDFNSGACNVVPMALAPTISLENDYPKGSISAAVFGAIGSLVGRNRDALARVGTFCDALLYSENILCSLDGLLFRETRAPFSLDESTVQFGKTAANNCRAIFNDVFRQISDSERHEYISNRPSLNAQSSCALSSNIDVIEPTCRLLKEGLATLALDSLLTQLAKAVGADAPESYSLYFPYTNQQVTADPYLRLRVGFTYNEISGLFKRYLSYFPVGTSSTELIVSNLMDKFIDEGAIVPTFSQHGQQCSRIYRKGESSPPWNQEFHRLRYAVSALGGRAEKKLLKSGRTRVAKITAIMAFSNVVETSLEVSPLERGNVGSLRTTVVEQHGGDLVGIMQRLGYWKK